MTRLMIRCDRCGHTDDLPKHHQERRGRRAVTFAYHRPCCGCEHCISLLLAIERYAVDHGVVAIPA